jgi:hypothetical protein
VALLTTTSREIEAAPELNSPDPERPDSAC